MTFNKLTDTTWVPLGLAVISIGGGAMWLTMAYAKVVDTAKRVEDQAIAQRTYSENMAEVRTQLAVIQVQIQELRGESANHRK